MPIVPPPPEPNTDEILAGQRLIIGFDGVRLSLECATRIQTMGIGGVILFSRNIESPDQLADLCRELQACAAEAGNLPLFIAIDQEGGEVARLKAPFTEFPGGAAMITTTEAAERFAAVTARELFEMGINMNMAPVMDVAFDPERSIMKRRAYGSAPEQVARLGTAVIHGLQDRGVMAVAKHFPGIGRTVTDSHLELPVLDAAPETLAADLLPFKAAIAGNVAGIMLSHILYPRLDPKWPASLSERIVSGMLRRDLGYNGVVMTDDLDMGAIAGHFDLDAAVDGLLAADVDIALLCHEGPAVDRCYKRMLDRIGADRRLRERARRSLDRIRALKRRFHLLPG